MKKVIALILSLVMMLSLMPFQSTFITNVDAVDTDDFHVSIFWNNYNDPHLKIIRETLNENLFINNYSCKNYNAENDQTTQTNQIETAIANGTDLLIISIVQQLSSAPQEIVDKAKAANVPVIFIEREVFYNSVFDSYNNACFVGDDPYEAGVAQGVMAGEYFIRNYNKIDLNGDGKISYIMMSGEIANPIAKSRTELSIEHANDILKSAGKPALSYYDASNSNLYQDANWSYTTASELMTKAIASNPMNGNSPIEAVFANNDDMALGCIKALNNVGWNTGEEDSPYIPVFGCDYTADCRSAIEAKRMTGSVKEPCESIVYPIMMMIENAATDLHIFNNISNTFPVDEDCAKVRVPYEIFTAETDHHPDISPSSIKGDVNGDYEVSTLDLVLMARYIVELEDELPVFENADVNRDGIITNADLVATAIIVISKPKTDFTAIYNQINSSSPVMSIGDIEIDWNTLYYFFYSEVSKFIEKNGDVYNWASEYKYGMTYFEYCLEETIFYHLQYIAGVEHFVNEHDVTLTEFQINKVKNELTIYYNSLKAKNVYISKETARHLLEIQYLYQNVMDEVVGKKGEKLTVEEIRALADTAYKSIKFVAIPKTAENAKANAEAALAEVKAAADKEAKIIELIDRYCENEKAEEYKTGYVFTRGYFDDEAVEAALREMDIGDLYSTVVVGEDYYYVLMRTEVDVDAYPYYGSNADSEEDRWGEISLRVLYSDDIFEQIFWDWADYADVDYYDNLIDTLDLNTENM